MLRLQLEEVHRRQWTRCAGSSCATTCTSGAHRGRTRHGSSSQLRPNAQHGTSSRVDASTDDRRGRRVSACSETRSDLDASGRASRLPAAHRLPRFPETLVDRIVEHFSGLQRIMRTSVADLEEVEGVGEARARSVKDGLARLAEASILDRYS